jgi:hypothetical protein
LQGTLPRDECTDAGRGLGDLLRQLRGAEPNDGDLGIWLPSSWEDSHGLQEELQGSSVATSKGNKRANMGSRGGNPPCGNSCRLHRSLPVGMLGLCRGVSGRATGMRRLGLLVGCALLGSAHEISRMHAAAAIRERVSGLLSHEVCSVVAMASGLATLFHGEEVAGEGPHPSH